MDLRLGLLRGRVREAAPDLEHAVAQLQEVNASVVASLRNLLVDLEPVAPGADLVALLRDAAGHALQGGRATVTVEVAGGDLARLGDEVVTTSLRIAQEALTNIRKHARATHVRILLGAGPRRARRDHPRRRGRASRPHAARARAPRPDHHAGPGGGRRGVVPRRVRRCRDDRALLAAAQRTPPGHLVSRFCPVESTVGSAAS